MKPTKTDGAMLQIGKVPASDLFVSEPQASWFGNEPNPPSATARTAAGWSNANWLKSRFHFSFAEYSNPRNAAFGCLRVLNDDLVQPGRGFGEHGHADMEIVTYIVQGRLTHRDSMGTAETLGRGAVQFMTAGRGVKHSEHNLLSEPVTAVSASAAGGQQPQPEPLRFLQLWITPSRRGLKPNYGSYTSTEAERRGGFAHLVSQVGGAEGGAPIRLNQDVNIYVAEMGGGGTASLRLGAERQAYVVCMEGGCMLQEQTAQATQTQTEQTQLTRHDAAEIGLGGGGGGGGVTLGVTALAAGAHCLVVEMAADGRGGRVLKA